MSNRTKQVSVGPICVHILRYQRLSRDCCLLTLCLNGLYEWMLPRKTFFETMMLAVFMTITVCIILS